MIPAADNKSQTDLISQETDYLPSNKYAIIIIFRSRIHILFFLQVSGWSPLSAYQDSVEGKNYRQYGKYQPVAQWLQGGKA